MSCLGPFEIWRLKKIKNLGDVEESLVELQRILETMQFILEHSCKFMTATLSGNQTTNLGDGRHVEFDTILSDSGDITLSTGAGQANGTFSLPPGAWRLVLVPAAAFSGSTGLVNLRWTDTTAVAVDLGPSPCRFKHKDNATNPNGPNTADVIFENSSPADIQVRISGATALNNIHASCGVTIFAL